MDPPQFQAPLWTCERETTRYFERSLPLMCCPRRRAGFTVSCGGGWETHAVPELGWHVEQSWPYYFLWKRLRDTGRSRAWLERGTELALRFLVEEWCSRQRKDAEEKEEEEKEDARLESYYSNMEGGE